MFKHEYAKQKIKDMGMTQTWLADQLHVSSQHLSNIVNGTRKPSMKLSEDMARIMGIDYRALWTEYDDVQVTHSEPETSVSNFFYEDWSKETFDVDEFRKQMAEQPIIVEETPNVNAKDDGIWLDKDEVEALLDWFEMGGLFDIIRKDPDVDSMEWLSAMMCLYAKCKAVAK